MPRIVSRPASAQFLVNFDKAFRRRKGSGVCGECHRWPCRCKVVLDRANAPAERRGGRARTKAKTEVPFRQLDEGTKAAARVLRLAKTPRERDMFESLLRTSGKLANKDQIEAGRREVQKRVHW